MPEAAGKRKNWIDVLRALAILFVIYGHLLEKTEHSYIYFVFTSPIKIPLFFAISGYLFKENTDIKTFAGKLLKGLIIPWLALSSLPVLFISIIKGSTYLTSNISAILIGKSVWYMPCCIIAEIVFYFVLRFLKNDWIKLGIVIAISCVGIILIHYGTLDFLMINRALSVQVFLMIGHMIHKNEDLLDKLKTGLLIVGIGVYAALGILSIIFYPGTNLDVHQGIYYNAAISFTMIIIGCVLLFIIGKRINFDNKILVFIGQNTLVYYILANYPITVYNAIASKLHITISNVYLSALIKTIFVCCLCAVFAVVINRFVPEIAGKRRRKVGKTK